MWVSWSAGLLATVIRTMATHRFAVRRTSRCAPPSPSFLPPLPRRERAALGFNMYTQNFLSRLWLAAGWLFSGKGLLIESAFCLNWSNFDQFDPENRNRLRRLFFKVNHPNHPATFFTAKQKSFFAEKFGEKTIQTIQQNKLRYTQRRHHRPVSYTGVDISGDTDAAGFSNCKPLNVVFPTFPRPPVWTWERISSRNLLRPRGLRPCSAHHMT